MASHEFRTPLTSINSSADLIKLYLEKGNNDGIQKHIGTIQGSVQHVHKLLEDFLSVTKLEENRIELYPTKINVEELLKEVITELEMQLKDGQSISFSSLGKDLISNTDQNIIKNIFYNLITNAIKYSEENKSIEVHLNRIGDEITVKIKDQGIGIPKAEQKFMFSRFFRASNTIGIKGTGLGLNIVKDYLDMLNSKIEFESEEGVGSTFLVSLSDME